MKTKEKILHKALELFNEHGLFRVTTRQVAASIPISHGNLTYHFAGREALLQGVYQMMFEEMEVRMNSGNEETPLDLSAMLKEFQGFIHRYRFFFMDLQGIAREFPAISKQHQQIASTRIEQGRQMLILLSQKGVLTFPETKHLPPRLSHMIWFASTFWLSQYPILPPDHPANQEDGLLYAISALLAPYSKNNLNNT